MALDINNIDLNNIGTAPLLVKVFVVVLVAATIIGLGFYFDTKSQLAEHDKSKAKELELRNTFEV